jgi:HK97 gp10 family phage protein
MARNPDRGHTSHIMKIIGEITPDSLKLMKEQFSRLNDVYQLRALQSAIRAAAKPMHEAARTRAQSFAYTGDLAEDLTIKSIRGRRKVVEAQIGVPRTSSRKSLVHLIEKGTSHSVARPFLRPAFEEKKQASADVFKTQLVRNMSRVLKRAQKQGAAR